MKSCIIILFWIVFAMGCSTSQKHGHTIGSVVALDSKNEAHVCLISSKSKIGELVDVYEVVCAKEKIEDTFSVKKARAYSTVCKKIRRGHAKIIENAGEHFSKIASEGDLTLKEGYIIETSIDE